MQALEVNIAFIQADGPILSVHQPQALDFIHSRGIAHRVRLEYR